MLLHSCDSLFATHQLINQNLLPHFPFLESIFDVLKRQLTTRESIAFEGVATKHKCLPGYYDYTFSLVQKFGQKIIKWQILDATENHEKVKSYQQNYQETILLASRSNE